MEFKEFIKLREKFRTMTFARELFGQNANMNDRAADATRDFLKALQEVYPRYETYLRVLNTDIDPREGITSVWITDVQEVLDKDIRSVTDAVVLEAGRCMFALEATIWPAVFRKAAPEVAL
jgi:hypothetical protein